jgi:hypothetical protein
MVEQCLPERCGVLLRHGIFWEYFMIARMAAARACCSTYRPHCIHWVSPSDTRQSGCCLCWRFDYEANVSQFRCAWIRRKAAGS